MLLNRCCRLGQLPFHERRQTPEEKTYLLANSPCGLRALSAAVFLRQALPLALYARSRFRFCFRRRQFFLSARRRPRDQFHFPWRSAQSDVAESPPRFA